MKLNALVIPFDTAPTLIYTGTADKGVISRRSPDLVCDRVESCSTVRFIMFNDSVYILINMVNLHNKHGRDSLQVAPAKLAHLATAPILRHKNKTEKPETARDRI